MAYVVFNSDFENLNLSTSCFFHKLNIWGHFFTGLPAWHCILISEDVLLLLLKPHFVKAGAALNDLLTFFAVCTRWQVVILQPTSHIHNPAGRRAPALVEWGTLPSSGDVSGLKGNPHYPATGGPWAQWENEDLCTPLNPQEFLIKHRSRVAEGPLGPHPPPVRGLPLWQGE